MLSLSSRKQAVESTRELSDTNDRVYTEASFSRSSSQSATALVVGDTSVMATLRGTHTGKHDRLLDSRHAMRAVGLQRLQFENQIDVSPPGRSCTSKGRRPALSIVG